MERHSAISMITWISVVGRIGSRRLTEQLTSGSRRHLLNRNSEDVIVDDTCPISQPSGSIGISPP